MIFTGHVIESQVDSIWMDVSKIPNYISHSIIHIDTFIKGSFDSIIYVDNGNFKPLIKGEKYFFHVVSCSGKYNLEYAYEIPVYGIHGEDYRSSKYCYYNCPFDLDTVLFNAISRLIDQDYVIFSGIPTSEQWVIDTLNVKFNNMKLVSKEGKIAFKIDSCYTCESPISEIEVFTPNGFKFEIGKKYLVYAFYSDRINKINRLRVVKPETLTIPFEYSQRHLKILNQVLNSMK